PVQPPPGGRGDDRSLAALADRQVDRRVVRGASGITACLPSLPVIAMAPVAAFCAKRLNIGSGGLGGSQPPQRQQPGQDVLGRREAGAIISASGWSKTCCAA